MVSLNALHSTQHLTQQKVTIDLTTNYNGLIFILALLTFLLILFINFSSQFQNSILETNVRVIQDQYSQCRNGSRNPDKWALHSRSAPRKHSCLVCPLVGGPLCLVWLCFVVGLKTRSCLLQHLDFVLRSMGIQNWSRLTLLSVNIQLISNKGGIFNFKTKDEVGTSTGTHRANHKQLIKN